MFWFDLDALNDFLTHAPATAVSSAPSVSSSSFSFAGDDIFGSSPQHSSIAEATSSPVVPTPAAAVPPAADQTPEPAESDLSECVDERIRAAIAALPAMYTGARHDRAPLVVAFTELKDETSQTHRQELAFILRIGGRRKAVSFHTSECARTLQQPDMTLSGTRATLVFILTGALGIFLLCFSIIITIIIIIIVIIGIVASSFVGAELFPRTDLAVAVLTARVLVDRFDAVMSFSGMP